MTLRMTRRILNMFRIATVLSGCAGAPIDTHFTQAQQVQSAGTTQVASPQHPPAAVTTTR